MGDKEDLSREMGIQLTLREENPWEMSHRKLEDKLKVKVGKFLNLSHYTSFCYFSQHIYYKHKHKFLFFSKLQTIKKETGVLKINFGFLKK